MKQWVEISFDCLPLRSLGRLDVPMDASPKYQQKCQRIMEAISKHGTHNSYFLHNARAVYHLTNHAEFGLLEFRFQGTVLTDPEDRKASSCDLEVELLHETCDWLTEPVVSWFLETVPKSVTIEFDRYIAAGDLEQTKQRIAKIQETSDEAGGFLGMYL